MRPGPTIDVDEASARTGAAVPSNRDYFYALADYSRGLLDRLPLQLTPQPLDYSLGLLAPRLDLMRHAEVGAIREFERPRPSATRDDVPGVGLNSIGMLADRFTILLIKEWCLRHKGVPSAAKADELFQRQTVDIIEAMDRSRPGTSAVNSKITHIKGGACAQDWAEAFYGLLGTNLLMWESQEMLYVKNISDAPEAELRDYIKWFSVSNMRRNEYISLCENWFWRSPE